MDHLKALMIKFIMCTAVLWIVLGAFYDVAFADILTIGVLLTGVSYIIGDLFLLPRFENWGATLADLGMAFAGIWLLGSFLIEGNIPLGNAAIISALIIAVGEYFFHQYMANHVLSGEDTFVTDREEDIAHSKLQTEFSEEITDDKTRDDD